MISSCVTDSAPWRTDVPMQSEPVSPPPITTTCFPAARIGSLTEPFAGDAAVLLRQKVHGEMHARQVAAGDGEVARLFRAARQDHRVMAVGDLLGGHGDADVDVIVEGDAFGLHLGDAAVDQALFQLEIGDAVAQQPAGLGGFLEDMDVVAGAGELLRRRQTRRAGADHRYAFAGLPDRRFRVDKTAFPGAIDDGAFHRLDGDGDVLEVQRARGLARRRADAARELREVVGGVQVARRLFPVAAIDQIVPVGDLVVDGAAVVAKGMPQFMQREACSRVPSSDSGITNSE